MPCVQAVAPTSRGGLRTLGHPPHNHPDGLMRDTVRGCQSAEALMPGALGDLRPEDRIDLRLVLRRGLRRDVTLHREVEEGREFVLA